MSFLTAEDWGVPKGDENQSELCYHLIQMGLGGSNIGGVLNPEATNILLKDPKRTR